MGESTMKKIGLLATSLIACMSLAGCGNKTSKLKIASDQSLTKVGHTMRQIVKILK